MERLADAAADRAHTRFIVSNDPEEVVEKIGWYVGLGFDHLVFHAPGEDQRRFLEQFCTDVLPRLTRRPPTGRFPPPLAARSRSAIARPSSARERIPSFR